MYADQVLMKSLLLGFNNMAVFELRFAHLSLWLSGGSGYAGRIENGVWEPLSGMSVQKAPDP